MSQTPQSIGKMIGTRNNDPITKPLKIFGIESSHYFRDWRCESWVWLFADVTIEIIRWNRNKLADAFLSVKPLIIPIRVEQGWDCLDSVIAKTEETIKTMRNAFVDVCGDEDSVK